MIIKENNTIILLPIITQSEYTIHSNLLIVPFNNYCRHIDEKGFFLLLIINYHRLKR